VTQDTSSSSVASTCAVSKETWQLLTSPKILADIRMICLVLIIFVLYINYLFDCNTKKEI
jgi:hypothetical protein